MNVFAKEKGKQELITKQKKIKLGEWRDKPLNEQYPSRTDEKGVSCWKWVEAEYLKRETESLFMAAQDQTLATNYHLEKSRLLERV